jgi:cytochrome c553
MGVPVYRQSLLIALLCTSVSSVAVAQSPLVADLVAKTMGTQPDARHGAVLYAKHCTSCHGGKAWGNGLKEVPSLAAQREIYLVTQLAQFATQERNGSAMHRATSAADVNHPQAIRDLAAHLSRAPANPRPEQGDGSASAAGEKLFQRSCAMCHGAAAQGSTEEPIPALAGQHYTYTLIQLKNFAAGHRGQVEPPVIDFTAGLSAADQQGIADYLSRIKRN